MPAVAVATETPAPEPVVTKVYRLAEELSLAMDDWMAEMSSHGAQAHWQAIIEPASYTPSPVVFLNVYARRPSKVETAMQHWRECQREATRTLAEWKATAGGLPQDDPKHAVYWAAKEALDDAFTDMLQAIWRAT